MRILFTEICRTIRYFRTFYRILFYLLKIVSFLFFITYIIFDRLIVKKVIIFPRFIKILFSNNFRYSMITLCILCTNIAKIWKFDKKLLKIIIFYIFMIHSRIISSQALKLRFLFQQKFQSFFTNICVMSL